MFGYVTVQQEELKLKDFHRYRAYYCGLCRALQKRYGVKGQMTLTYDMTFLAILLTAYREETLREEKHLCVVHPGKKQTMLMNAVTDYAADMSVLLAWYKCQDDILDDKSVKARAMARTLDKAKEKVAAAYPRQARAVAEGFRRLREAELSGSTEIDLPAGAFGDMIAELFVWQEDIWSGEFRQLGFFLGKYIYLLDAYDDIVKDIKKNEYNPWRSYASRRDFEALVENTLTMMISECAKSFERLPIVQDVDILRNILYSGVWAKYEDIRKKREKAEEGKR